MTAAVLDSAYLEDLVRDQYAPNRVNIAIQLADCALDMDSSPAEIEHLLPFLMRLADDVVLDVRLALARTVMASARAPRKLLFAMIGDVEDISLPLLTLSPVFTERDLAAIVARSDPARQAAIAMRKRPEAMVCDAIIAASPEAVVMKLLENASARLSPTQYRAVLEKCGTGPDMTPLLLARRDLPATLRVRLLCGLRDTLDEFLPLMPEGLSGPGVPVLQDMGDDPLLACARQAAVGDLERLVTAFHHEKTLNAELLLRAVCRGDVAFIEMALAFLARMPLSRARSLIQGRGRMGFAALCRMAGLPPAAGEILRMGIVAARPRVGDGERTGEIIAHRMIEQIMISGDDRGDCAKDRLLSLMSRFATPEAAGLAARLGAGLEDRAA